MYFLRVLFPTWRFFEKQGHTFQVWLQLKNQTSWTPLIPKNRHSIKYLFFNPYGNFQHAIRSCAEQFIIEISKNTSQNIENNPRYLTLRNFCALTSNASGPWRFKITAHSPQNPTDQEDVFISAWQETES
ncbi:MAG: hypothetical protein ACLGGX_04635 [Bdellovibrionia bacterium]